jgi:hypothetical protein
MIFAGEEPLLGTLRLSSELDSAKKEEKDFTNVPLLPLEQQISRFVVVYFFLCCLLPQTNLFAYKTYIKKQILIVYCVFFLIRLRKIISLQV